MPRRPKAVPAPPINEAGSASAFQAVGTSYATHGEPLIPFYFYYSMFGFQRTGDQFWAAGDQMARGFLIGATAGRTTLTGEGLQHADGHSPLLAGTMSHVVHYDPAYGYEIRHIVRDGIKRMYGEDDGRDPDVIYYLRSTTSRCSQPAEPEGVDVEGILRGIHQVASAEGDGPRAQILASGVAVPWALEAQQLLADDWGVHAAVWSVTSWNELRRDGLAADQQAFLHPGEEARVPYLTQKLQGAEGPFVATTDYDHLVADQVRAWIPGTYATLGADGFGFSDTRAAARRHFKIDGPSTAVRVLQQLARAGARRAATRRRRRSSGTACTTSPPARPATRAATADGLTRPTTTGPGGAIRRGPASSSRPWPSGAAGCSARRCATATTRPARPQVRDRPLVRVQVERREVLLGLERSARLDRGEHELARDLGVVLARAPVPDAEAERVDRAARPRAARRAPRRAPCPTGRARPRW